MAIEKMTFVNIVGRVNDMDDFVMDTIVPFDIQFKDAENILEDEKKLAFFEMDNPYDNINKRLANISAILGVELKYSKLQNPKIVDSETIEPRIVYIEQELQEYRQKSEEIKEILEYKRSIKAQIIPIKDLDIQVDELFHFDYMKFRFGRMPRESYNDLKKYVSTLNVIAYEVEKTENYSYVIYFTSNKHENNIDKLFESLFFERIRISDEVVGKPKEAIYKLENEIADLEAELKILKIKIDRYKTSNSTELQELYDDVVILNKIYETRKYALRTDESFYITGWLPISQVEEFQEMVTKNPKISIVIDEDEDIKAKDHPTKLINKGFFKPFETLVEMYGVPAYSEIDPTPFVGITFILFFGLMFGDLGQGAVFVGLGILLYKKVSKDYGQLLMYLGTAAMVSGFFYGSFFGNEEILRELFPSVPHINLMENIMTVLGAGIGIGIIIILLAMIINLIVCFKNRNFGKLIFDHNGIIGIVFYLALVYSVVSIVAGNHVPVYIYVLFIIAPVISFFFTDKLERWVNKTKEKTEEDSNFITAFFEVFEVLLSIASNTISFVRIGAFALNHVGFFMAFKSMAELANGVGSVIILVIGNIVIIGLEGLIVGIQSMRLEYYEIFSKFYSGDGYKFNPYKIK